MSRVIAVAVLLGFAANSPAQRPPEAGFIFPAGGKAGATVQVHLGGYDWTPDMEFFVHDKRVKLTPTGAPGPILIPGPPYWFGAKGRLGSLPLPREVPAKMVIPADFPPGPIYWQAANANGCTTAGVFIIGAGTEVVEEGKRKKGSPPPLLPTLPITVSGRLSKIEEVDRYRFVAPKDGPITCELMARRLGSKFSGILEVREKDKILSDAAGTSGSDPSLTFVAKKNVEYLVSVRDIDFNGDRSFVYRLTVTPGPRVMGAIPAAGKRGETREVEFVGIGVATGGMKLESVKRRVVFPAAETKPFFEYRLETPHGFAPAFRLFLGDWNETVSVPHDNNKKATLILPAGVTGVLEKPDAEDHYFCSWKKGEVWALSLEARRLGSPLDVSLAILGPDGKEIVRNDDLPGTTDAGLDFTVPLDGLYQIVVRDVAGKGGKRSSIYRLVVRKPAADFALQAPAHRVSVPLGGKFDFAVKAIRYGGFTGPIALTISGLPAGVTAPANPIIPAGKNEVTVSLQASKDAAVAAGLMTVEGKAAIASQTKTRLALAPTTQNLAPRSPEENHISNILVAITMKQRFKGRPVDQDTGRKVHLGTTFPAEVLVDRLDGFNGEITLQMAAQQSYQVQGITGGEVIVPPGVSKTIYPCFMPEWLETTRTSRMGMIAVAKVPDPKGKVRYLVADITGFITMTMEGALLKLSAEDQEIKAKAGQPFDVRLKISQSTKLAEPARLELRVPEELAGQLMATPIMVAAGKKEAVFTIKPAAALRGLHSFTIRATALQNGKYPAISETKITCDFGPAMEVPSRKR
jgi:hypothetical protein